MKAEKIKDGVVMESEEQPEKPRGAFCLDFNVWKPEPATYYSRMHGCDNCGRTFYVYIPKGVRKEYASWSHVCARCGVRQTQRGWQADAVNGPAQ